MLSSWATTIGDQVRREKPDVLVLEAGLNDLRHGDTPAKVLARIRRLRVAGASRQARPALHRLARAGVARARLRALAARITSYDALLTSRGAEAHVGVVARHDRGDDDRVVGVHDDLGRHASQPGGGVLLRAADRPGPGVSRAIPGFGQPAIRTVRTWERRPPVQVVIRRGRALISWDTERSTGAKVWIKRPGHAAKVSRAPSESRPPRSQPQARRGRDLQLPRLDRRRAMVTPYGAVTRVVRPREARRHHG